MGGDLSASLEEGFRDLLGVRRTLRKRESARFCGVV
jgi:hypothetical protein